MEHQQKCPICKSNVFPMARYKNYICEDCIERYPPVTEQNELIKFYNQDPSGGFISVVDGIEGKIQKCFINGIECKAEEARFGGIVIQKVIKPMHETYNERKLYLSE